MSDEVAQELTRLAISKAYLLGVEDATKRRTDPSVEFKDLDPLLKVVAEECEEYWKRVRVKEHKEVIE